MKFLKAKKIVSIVLAALIFGVALFGTYTDAEAAGKKVTTKVTYSNWTKAPRVKTGKTTVVLKEAHAGVAFIAPKTKVYKVTVSNFVNNNDKKGRLNGYIGIMTAKPGSKNVYYTEAKTQGGKSSTLWVANKAFLKNWKNRGSYKTSYLYPSRTATIKLQKGQPLFLHGYFSQNTNVTYTLTIK